MTSDEADRLGDIATSLRYIKEYLGDMLSGENPLYEIPKKLDKLDSIDDSLIQILHGLEDLRDELTKK